MNFILINGIKIFGINIDPHTRCLHYHSDKDIIAIRMKCCNKFYACSYCHNELEQHKITPWDKEEFDKKAILCGNCGYFLTIAEYFSCRFICPHCESQFNPNCQKHFNIYFKS